MIEKNAMLNQLWESLKTPQKESTEFCCEYLGYQISIKGENVHIKKQGIEYTVEQSSRGDIPNYVFGLNHENFNPERDFVVTIGSAIARAMAFPIQVMLDNNLKIDKGEFFGVTTQISKEHIGLYQPEIGREVRNLVHGLNARIEGYVIETRLSSQKTGFVKLTLLSPDEIYIRDLRLMLIEAELRYQGRLKALKSVNRQNLNLNDQASSVVILPGCTSNFIDTGEYFGSGDIEDVEGINIINLLIGYKKDSGSAMDQALLTKYVIEKKENEKV